MKQALRSIGSFSGLREKAGDEGVRPTHEMRRVLEAAHAAGSAAIAVDGRMVDKPVLLRAQRLLQS